MAQHSLFNKETNIKQACGMPLLPFKTPNASFQNQNSQDVIEEAFQYFRVNVLFKNFEIKGPGDKVLVYLFVLISHLFKTVDQIKDQATAKKRLSDIVALPIPTPKQKANFMAGMLQDIPNERENYNQYIKQLKTQTVNRFLQKRSGNRRHKILDGAQQKKIYGNELCEHVLMMFYRQNLFKLSLPSYFHFFQIMKVLHLKKNREARPFSIILQRLQKKQKQIVRSQNICEMFTREKLSQSRLNKKKLNNFRKVKNIVQLNINQNGGFRDSQTTVHHVRNHTGRCYSRENIKKSENEICLTESRPKHMHTKTSVLRIKTVGNQSFCEKKENNYPKYKMLELYALYQSILKYSKNDPERLFHSFQTALTFQKIIIKSDIIRKNLFERSKLEFQDFVQVYKKMQDLIFIQSIIDYLEIIFQAECNNRKMKHRQIYNVLAKRSSSTQQTLIVTDMIFERMGKDIFGEASLKDIIQLCQKDIDFCSQISNLYYQQKKRNEI